MATKPPHLGAKPRKQAERERKRRYDQGRAGDEVRALYSSTRWRVARMHFLAEHPLCIECQGNGRTEPATVIDHIEPHKGDLGKFWNQHNWRAVCKRCHDTGTVLYDGGFGREIKVKPKNG